jgi:hypothetical protein
MLPERRVLQPMNNVPRRIAQLSRLLSWLSLTLVCLGLSAWLGIGRASLGPEDGLGPWPVVLGLGFVLGLLGAGCSVVALSIGGVPRRRTFGAMTVSIAASTIVGIVALALFFASTTLNWS